MSGNNKTLILGLGNDILMDDGVGPKLMRVVAEHYPSPDFEYETAALGGMELIEMRRDDSRVIIIDAIMTRGGIPGAVYHLTPANFKETSHISNLHDISFLTALNMAESLDIYISDRID
ncbi:MAG: hydrogenase maturation protease, partial [Candidatus Omnitrophica bacterium]|nr:hydrogenase maturation protease [Candidatus Omnitrophota bacterium]